MTALPMPADDGAVSGAPRRSWRGVSGEARAAARRDLLIDAAFDLLGTEGWAAVTVRGVCRSARLHPRYFYQAFEDSDDLLVAVFDRLIDELRHAVADAIDAVDPDRAMGARQASQGARSRAGLEAVARYVSEDPRRARVLYTEALGNDRLNRRRIETMQQFVGVLVPRGVNPASEVAAHIAVGGFTSALIAWLDGRLEVTLDELIEDSAVVLLAAGRAASRIARP